MRQPRNIHSFNSADESSDVALAGFLPYSHDPTRNMMQLRKRESPVHEGHGRAERSTTDREECQRVPMRHTETSETIEGGGQGGGEEEERERERKQVLPWGRNRI